MMLVGIYYSAISAAQDSRLRHMIRSSVQTQSNLLEFISVAQMEVQIQRRVFDTLSKTSFETTAWCSDGPSRYKAISHTE